MNGRITISLGRDGNPQGQPPSAWVIIQNDEMHFEVQRKHGKIAANPWLRWSEHNQH
jgi:hypothetical protein